jgi:iron complex outermembrane receptor protein
MKFRLIAAWGLLAASSVVHAQRTDDNVTAQSEDAFGRSVGNERLGIYSPDEVRGFSPTDAGNVRIEGLYFDRQANPTMRLVDESSIRVGITSQSYPFPSPTGIVDYELRRVGAKRVISSVLFYGPFGTLGLEVDAQLPIDERLGLVVGTGFYREAFEWGGDNRSASFAVIPHWTPAPGVEIRPFFSMIEFRDEEPQPLMITANEALPPEIRRNRFFGQPWAQSEGQAYTYGVLGDATFGAWTTRLGVFQSVLSLDREFAELFTDIDVGGNANELVIAFPKSRFWSTSGEFRAARAFEEGNRRHSILFMLRARDQQRRFGGEQLIDVGPIQLGVGRAIAEPDYVFGAQTRDEVKQQTAGAAYELRVKDLVDISLGLQRTSYSKRVETPTGALPSSKDDLWLKTVTATLYASSRLAFYGSYTEGLEESPVAPDNAINRNVAAPALHTEQYDAGIRYRLPANLTLIAGVFDLKKPYFGLDSLGAFTQLGTVRHRGLEFSLAGTPWKNLTVVAGARFLDAEVSASSVTAGLIGREPVGSSKNYSVISVDYALGDSGLSFDATAEGISSQVANTSNTARVPERAVLHVGGRYRFELMGKPVTLRAQISNVFDRFGWSAVSSGAYVHNAPRRYTVYLAADL